MSRKFLIKGTELGADLTDLAIYHTEVTASNLLVASITSSLLGTSGVEIEVPDDVTTIIARCINGDCSARTGSLVISPYAPNTRYFDVFSDGQGYVSATLPTTVAQTTTNFSKSVNYNTDSLFVIQASEIYPYVFEGWYNAVSGSGTLISTESQLSIGQNDYTASLTGDKIYAYFG